MEQKTKFRENIQDDKKLEIGPHPSFSLGLTPDDMINKEKHVRHLTTRNHIKGHVEENRGDRGRVRIKSKIGKVYQMVTRAKLDKSKYRRKLHKLESCGFGIIVDISNWKSISSTFVKWVIENWEIDDGPQIRLGKNKVLKITEADVQRVYNLPSSHKPIDLRGCSDRAIDRLRKELEIEGPFARSVHYHELEDKLDKLHSVTSWTKAAILYVIFCLLCPVTGKNVDLRYADILENLNDVNKHNWCRHVLEHTTNGITERNKLTPTSDFHFLLVNYLERMGKNCRLQRGQVRGASLRGWNESIEMSNLCKIDELVGLSKAVAVGVTKQRRREDARIIVHFDPHACPIGEIPNHVEYCTGEAANRISQAEAFRDCLDILNRRLDKFHEQYTFVRKQTSTIFDKGQTSSDVREKRKQPHTLIDESMSSRKNKSKEPTGLHDFPLNNEYSRPGPDEVLLQQPEINQHVAGKIENPELLVYVSKKNRFGNHLCMSKTTDDNTRIDDLHAKEFEKQPPNKERVSPSPSPNGKRFKHSETLMTPSNPTPLVGQLQTSMKDNKNDEFLPKSVNEHPINQTMGENGTEANTKNKDLKIDTIPSEYEPGPLTQKLIMECINDENGTSKAVDDHGVTRNLEEEFDAATEDFRELDVLLELIDKNPDQLAAAKDTTEPNPTKMGQASPIFIDLTNIPEPQSSPEVYRARRRRLYKPSWYLLSPYHTSLEDARVDEEAKIIASYAWDHDLQEKEYLYKCGERWAFSLTRREFWTLAQNEWVTSRVIDAWANFLTMRESYPKMKRIYTKVIHDKEELRNLSIDAPTVFLTSTDAALKFRHRLSAFTSVDWQTFDVDSLEWIVIPAIYQKHFICYVINLAQRRFEYLTSLSSYGRTDKNGKPSGLTVIGDNLVKEATCFIDMQYQNLRQPCPHVWSDFIWSVPAMPQQMDTNSCGVFVMKYMEEWNGNSERMPSFNGWPKYRTSKSIEKSVRLTNEFRVKITNALVMDCNNIYSPKVYDKAKLHHTAEIGKMWDAATSNGQ